ncbi:MAG: DUF58 domain-containing protein, partial [Leptospiraceae bacterium]|nr:DUF58 domain-containing protein [Leptospiraceae bacterium]
QIEFKHRKKIRSIKAGGMLSTKIGRGMDFKDVREYSYGDDTRFIDWNVTSRTGNVHVKVFHEENDRLINIFLDISSSMLFSGSNDYNKFFIGFQFLAFILLLSLHSGDRVNIVLYSDKVEEIHKDVKTKTEAYKILKKIYSYSLLNKKTSHHLPFQLLKDRMPRKSVSYIISDFAGLSDLGLYRPLQELHELYAIRVSDRSEEKPEDKVFKYFFINRIEEGTGGPFYRSSFHRESKLLAQFYRNNLLHLRTDSELGKEILYFMSK